MLHPAPIEGGGTEVDTAGSRSPTVRRRELGTLLKQLRTERGWTAEQVGKWLRFSPSKMSRLETGHRGANARDINDLCDLYGVDDEQRRRLLELASKGKQRAWWLPLGLPYSTYVGLESEAVSISDFSLGFIPGLLQTTDYARAIVRAVLPDMVPEIVEQRVQGRMARQQLLDRENAPHFEAVIDESALHRVVGRPAVMRAQLERLLELSERPNVALRVIPYKAGGLPAGNRFIILRFASAEVKDVVFIEIEGLTGDMYLDDPDEVETYNTTFRTLVQLAASSEKTRAIIAAMIPSYGPPRTRRRRLEHP